MAGTSVKDRVAAAVGDPFAVPAMDDPAAQAAADALGPVRAEFVEADTAAPAAPSRRRPARVKAPRKAASVKVPDEKAPARPPAPKRMPLPTMEKKLRAIVTAVGVGVSMRNQADGQAIIAGAERLAKALVAVAQDNPSVRSSLEMLLTTGAWSQLAAALAMIAIPIAANHGAIPPGLASLWQVIGGLPDADEETTEEAPVG